MNVKCSVYLKRTYYSMLDSTDITGDIQVFAAGHSFLTSSNASGSQSSKGVQVFVVKNQKSRRDF